MSSQAPSPSTTPPPALLAMEDGTVYRGLGFGSDAESAGEIVFNTAITGYQEVITDPSYRGQIVTMTAPEIGNVGVNPVDFESARPWCAGFVVRALSPVVSNWRASGGLHALLAEHGIAGISGIDTRAVTRRIRLVGRAARRDHPQGRRPGGRGRAGAQAPVARGARPGARGDGRIAVRVGRGGLARRRRRPQAGSAPPRRRLRLRHQARHPAPPALGRRRGSPWCRPRPAPRRCWR